MMVSDDTQSALLLELIMKLSRGPVALPDLLALIGRSLGLRGAAVYGTDPAPLATWGEPFPGTGGLPLRRGGRTLGVLALPGAALDQLRPEVAAAVALHLADELHARAQDDALALVSSAGSAIRRLFEQGAVATSVEEAGEILAQVTADLFRTERAGVHLVGPDGRIRHTVGVGLTPQMSEALSRSLLGKLARDSPVWRRAEDEGGPVLVDDVRHSAVREGGFARTLQVRSYVAMPLLSATGIVGMAMCGDHSRSRVWSDTEHEMARRLALQGALVVDGARLRQAERNQLVEVTHRAFHDGLTGLPNRTLLMERLDRAVAGHSAALLLIDLDGFKGVNDRLGHHAGDLLLQQVARRLDELVGAEDTVARLGGDEFAVLVLGRLPAEDEALAARIYQRIAQPFDLDGEPVHVGGSVGIARYPSSADNASELLRYADAAMYHAKRHRSGPYVYVADAARAA